MKKNKLNILAGVLIIPLSLFISCKSNPTNSIKEMDHQSHEQFYYDSLSVEEINKLIIGKWEWDHSIIMSRGIHPPDNLITPAAAGYSMQQSFYANNTVDDFKNNELIGTHSYEIRKFKVLPQDEGFVTEIFIDGYGAQLLFFHPDTMMIGNGWSDGINAYFTRKEK
jgi:hypothetical protein